MAEVRDIIGRCASLAALLEVSAYPKPGNVHRLRDFEGTTYEHFLASSVSIAPWMGSLAKRSREIVTKGRNLSGLRIGRSILKATEDMLRWQSGGNVHLGVILLFSPISAAAGVVFDGNSSDPVNLRRSLRNVLGSATSQDAVDIYRTINIAMSRENLGVDERLDVTDPKSIEQILQDNITPVKIFEMCTERDSVCSEWVTGFEITFEESYPYLKSQLMSNGVNTSILNTFLTILSKHPDSLIKRKRGVEDAERMSQRARMILEVGGAATQEGKRMLFELDDELQKEKGSMNPGTSADLTAASLFVLLLAGWRP